MFFPVPDAIFWFSHTFLDSFLPFLSPSLPSSFLPFVTPPQSPSLLSQLSVRSSVTYVDHLRSSKVLTTFPDFQEFHPNWPLLSFSHPLGSTSTWSSTIFCWQSVQLMIRDFCFLLDPMPAPQTDSVSYQLWDLFSPGLSFPTHPVVGDHAWSLDPYIELCCEHQSHLSLALANFIVHANHLGLLKYGFCFDTSRWALRLCTSNQVSGDAGAAGLWTTLRGAKV